MVESITARDFRDAIYIFASADMFTLMMCGFALTMDNFSVFWECWNIDILISIWFGAACVAVGIVRPFVGSSFVQQREILHICSLPSAIRVQTCQNCSLAIIQAFFPEFDRILNNNLFSFS